jgi:hypothetical protein
MRLNIPAALKGTAKRDFIGIFQISAYWQTAGKTRNLYLHRLNQAG